MIKIALFTAFVSFRSLFFPCHSDIKKSGFKKTKSTYKLKRIGQLPAPIIECSGFELLSDKTLIAHNDGGSKPTLFYVQEPWDSIRIGRSIDGAQNIDWEDICIDNKNTIYIGDFGNNLNRRKNLRIYKVSEFTHQKLEVIDFTYEDQRAFPPEKTNMNYDCEAMFYANDSLYLISKNRGQKEVKLYTLSIKKSDQVARIKSTIRLNGMITGADINPSKTELALLSYGYIYFFDIKSSIDFSHPTKCLYYGRLAQSESIVYTSDSTLLIGNEKGKLFLLNQKDNN